MVNLKYCIFMLAVIATIKLALVANLIVALWYTLATHYSRVVNTSVQREYIGPYLTAACLFAGDLSYCGCETCIAHLYVHTRTAITIIRMLASLIPAYTVVRIVLYMRWN
jgi:hypothetical protein